MLCTNGSRCTAREHRHQNDLLSLPTQVRLIARFQDVRILAIGVLGSPGSLWVNRNAFSVLHPPGLEEWPHRTRTVAAPDAQPTSVNDSQTDTITPFRAALRDRRLTVGSMSSPVLTCVSPPTKTIRRLSEGNSQTLSSEASGGKVRRLFRTISRGTDEENHEAGGTSPPTTSGRLSSLFLGRRRSREVDAVTVTKEEYETARSDVAGTQTEVSPKAPTNSSEASQQALSSQSAASDTQEDESHSTDELPYKLLRKPQPAYTHRLYPNYTPLDEDTLSEGGDLRSLYAASRAPGAYSYGPRTGSESNEDERWVPVELDDVEGQRSWVGPMLCVAISSHPSTPGINGTWLMSSSRSSPRSIMAQLYPIELPFEQHRRRRRPNRSRSSGYIRVVWVGRPGGDRAVDQAQGRRRTADGRGWGRYGSER